MYDNFCIHRAVRQLWHYTFQYRIMHMDVVWILVLGKFFSKWTIFTTIFICFWNEIIFLQFCFHLIKYFFNNFVIWQYRTTIRILMVYKQWEKWYPDILYCTYIMKDKYELYTNLLLKHKLVFDKKIARMRWPYWSDQSSIWRIN